MSQTTPPRGPLPAAVADVSPALGAQAGGAERLARLSVAPTRPPALRRWNVAWGRVPVPRGARAGGRWSRAAEADAARGPSKPQPSCYELSGMTVPTHYTSIRDGGMVTAGGPGAGSMRPVMRIFCRGE